jgi:hypothetical protein
MMTETRSERKRFTQAEAERMLPLVRSIVRDLVGHHRALAERLTLYEGAVAASRRRAEPPAGFDVRAAESEIRTLHTGLISALRELERLGVACKDPDRGVVEFPAEPGPLIWAFEDDRVVAT